jgi:phage major head subunit gpT-like protein
MGALTPSLFLGFEDRLSTIAATEYAAFQQNLWWKSVAKVRQSSGRKEIISWLLSTAQIKDAGSGGNVEFDDLVSTYTEITNKNAATGLKLRREQLEDTDGGGLDLASHWARDVGAYMAYWPQKQVAALLVAGESTTGYDGKALFATDHPVCPGFAARGTYANLFTSSASGAYPGALPIGDAVSHEVAINNLAKLYSYMRTIKMPNGEDPRFLRPAYIVAPPQLYPRVVNLCAGKGLFPVAASSGSIGGTADMTAYIGAMGFGQPVEAPELSADATSYYVIFEQAKTSELGGVIYLEREPFSLTNYGAGVIPQLDRMREFEWQVHGRNATAPGHPFLIAKCKAT